MYETCVIILAAGLSRRMGAQNKLLLPVDGRPMIRHVVNTYRVAVDGPVLVVLGHEATAVRDALSGVQAQTILNQDYATGQASSVAAGLRGCTPARNILIGLGDQPELRAIDLHDLLRAHTQGHADKISIPVSPDGTRGNPIVVPWSLRARLLEDDQNPGCHRFTRAHPEYAQAIPRAAPGFFADVDTPAAYAALSPQPQEPYI